jgi:predicted nuclease of restriction endonuclease-like (RecB) superfamily
MAERRPFALLPDLLGEIKARVVQARASAVLAVNSELVRLYWDVGRMIADRQRREGWGAAVIPRLARSLKEELPGAGGFSERNIGRMIAFFRAYPEPAEFLPQAVAKLPPGATARGRVPTRAAPAQAALWSVPWGHHAVLMDKVAEPRDRAWYMSRTVEHGWSRNVLLTMIRSEAHRRDGVAVSNFERVLPPAQSDLVRQAVRDPYIFDFLTLDQPLRERELELGLLRHLERFLLELGQGFAFVGRQVRLDVGGRDFALDLLFFHLRIRCYIVIDLRTGEFKPEYAGKMNFYLGVVDDRFRHATDGPSIGLILCQDRDRIIAEYALRDAYKPIGIAEYQLTRALPADLTSALPTVEQIEAELGEASGGEAKAAPVLPEKAMAKTSKRNGLGRR